MTIRPWHLLRVTVLGLLAVLLIAFLTLWWLVS